MSAPSVAITCQGAALSASGSVHHRRWSATSFCESSSSFRKPLSSSSRVALGRLLSFLRAKEDGSSRAGCGDIGGAQMFSMMLSICIRQTGQTSPRAHSRRAQSRQEQTCPVEPCTIVALRGWSKQIKQVTSPSSPFTGSSSLCTFFIACAKRRVWSCASLAWPSPSGSSHMLQDRRGRPSASFILDSSQCARMSSRVNVCRRSASRSSTPTSRTMSRAWDGGSLVRRLIQPEPSARRRRGTQRSAGWCVKHFSDTTTRLLYWMMPTFLLMSSMSARTTAPVANTTR
mmetsp:Transcript_304/g.1219  ORF Transcript_304/g.1219 Transcript_304/m.1219 type:complete len:287 (-) Transcript_304:65-925(-)